MSKTKLIENKMYYMFDYSCMKYRKIYFKEELNNGECLTYIINENGEIKYGIVEKDSIIVDPIKISLILEYEKLKDKYDQMSDKLSNIREEMYILEKEIY